jgi:hypothetical protein
MSEIIFGHLILAIPFGIGAAAVLWRWLRKKTHTGYDLWSGRRELGFGPQARQLDLR